MLGGLLLLAGCSKSVEATHKVLAWDRNTEPDMKEYRVYQCATTPCAASGTPFATVIHTGTPAFFSTSIPDTDQFYVVYAVDTALNVSAPSSTVQANLLAPASPSNVRIQ